METPELFKAFGVGLVPFDGPIDIEYLIDIPSRSAGQAAIDFLSNQANEITLQKHHGYADMIRMWKGVLRGCIAHGVPLTPNQEAYAGVLGIVLPG